MIQLATNQVMASCGTGNFSVPWPILTHFTWKIFVFWLKCHRNLFLVVQLKICNQWLRHRLGTKPATSYCLDDQTIVARWSQGHNKFTVLVGLLIRGGSPVLMSRVPMLWAHRGDTWVCFFMFSAWTWMSATRMLISNATAKMFRNIWT